MIRGVSGAVAVAVAALIVCCHADPHQEQDAGAAEHGPADRYDAGHKAANLEVSGGRHLMRPVREAHRPLPTYLLRRYDYPSQYGRRDLWPLSFPMDYYSEGLPKRNYDDYDRTAMYVNRRNFDEIDQTSMPFPYTKKRFSTMYGNYIDSPSVVQEEKKKSIQDGNFDEIDLSAFPIGSKRSMNWV